MTALVTMDWVAGRLQQPGYLVLDPRLAMRYLQGHLPGAVNVPLPRAFGSEGALRPPAALAEWLGAAGLADDVTPIVYDGYDGQRGAFLAWLLEYLGRADVHLMDTFYDGWVAARRPVVYRATTPHPASFTPRLNDAVRADLAAVQAGDAALLDVRSAEEYAGAPEVDPRPGHIPGARHLAWRELAGPRDGSYLAPEAEIAPALAARGLDADRPVIAYCRGGPRAALAYLALRRLGYTVRLFDGSYAAWQAAELPVEQCSA